MKNGVSEYLAFDGNPPKYLTKTEKLAWRIVFGELNGGKWDRETKDWKRLE